jgi:hypothetical protein
MYIKDLTLSYDKTSKGEVFPAHAMKAYTGSSSIVPLILNLATIWKQVVFITRPLYPPKKEPPYALNRRLSGLQSCSGHFTEHGNIFTLQAMKPKIAQTTD